MYTRVAGVSIRDASVGQWEEKATPRGVPYRRWVRKLKMSRIPDHFLDCSVYLYQSIKAAQDDDKAGGSGFLVHVPSEHEGWVHLYAVTNKHVLDSGCHVLRLNTHDGKSDVLDTNPNGWVFHPDGDDIAVTPLDVEAKAFRRFSIGTNDFVTPEIIADFLLGPGDDIFLIGRLVTLEGRRRNTPVVRFGNISMMASKDEPITVSGGHAWEAFLVECRSLSGFSGSPVFVKTWRTYSGDHMPVALQPPQGQNGSVQARLTMASGPVGPWLLGINFAHEPLWKPVCNKDDRSESEYVVDANTGIACVSPAWKLLEVLNDRELVRQRHQDDLEIGRRKSSGAVLDRHD